MAKEPPPNPEYFDEPGGWRGYRYVHEDGTVETCRWGERVEGEMLQPMSMGIWPPPGGWKPDPEVEKAVQALDALTDIQRYGLMQSYCRRCGRKQEQDCQCSSEGWISSGLKFGADDDPA